MGIKNIGRKEDWEIGERGFQIQWKVTLMGRDKIQVKIQIPPSVPIGPSTDRACGVGVMSEGSIPGRDWKKSYC